jgi:hypothetical protein
MEKTTEGTADQTSCVLRYSEVREADSFRRKMTERIGASKERIARAGAR